MVRPRPPRFPSPRVAFIESSHCVIYSRRAVSPTPSFLPHFYVFQPRPLFQLLASHTIPVHPALQKEQRSVSVIPYLTVVSPPQLRQYASSHTVHRPANRNSAHHTTRQFSQSCHSSFKDLPTMSSDDAYSSFLESANADPSATVKSTSTTQSFHTTQSVGENQQVPQVLKNVEMYYVSDADEEFEPVTLQWDKAMEGKWPTTDEFQSLILLGKNKPSVEISTLPETSFDPRKQYEAVYDAIRTAVTGSEAKGTSEPELKVYRVQHSDTRMEYWVMGLDKKEHRLLGMKARAIES